MKIENTQRMYVKKLDDESISLERSCKYTYDAIQIEIEEWEYIKKAVDELIGEE